MMESQEPRVVARRGFFPVVVGEEVSLKQAGASVCHCRGDLSVTQGGAQLLAAGGDLSVRQGGALMLAAGGSATINEGGALMLAAGGNGSISDGGAAVVVAGGEARLERSYVGILIGRSAQVSDDSRVLIGSRQAAVLGVVAGLVCALIKRLSTSGTAG